MSSEVFSFQLETPFEEEIQWMTVVSEAESGREQRYQKWLRSRRSFRIRLTGRQSTESGQIWSFYQRHKGAYDTFLFQNPNENPVTNENIGSGDGTQATFYVGGSTLLANTGDVILAPGTLTVQRSIGGTGDYLSYSSYSVNENIGQLITSPTLPSGDILRASYTLGTG